MKPLSFSLSLLLIAMSLTSYAMERDHGRMSVHEMVEKFGDEPLYSYYPPSLDDKDDDFEIPTHTPLHVTVHLGDSASLKSIIASGISVDAPDGCGSTPLHWAIHGGSREVIEELLKRGAQPNIQGWLGETALHIALKDNHPELVPLLLEHKADPNIHEHDFNTTPLHEAAIHGNVEAIELLVEHSASVDAVNKAGQTALHVAAFNNHWPAMNALLKAGACIDATTYDKSMPEAIELPRDFNVTGRWTALHTAASQECIEPIEGLIHAGANTILEDQISRTPLHIAAQYGSIAAIRSLFTLDRERQESIINDPDIFGQTPLHLASYKWKFVSYAGELLNLADRYLAIISTLVGHRANIAITDENENTPLHYAYNPYLYNRSKLLLELKAPINAQNREGYTALHFAAHALNYSLVKLLLENGADTSISDKNGHIPLDLAAHQRGSSDREEKIKITTLLRDHKPEESDK